jgi:hypothetical protein
MDSRRPPTQMDFEKATLWIREYNLPLACMGSDIGKQIGSTVGLVEEVELVNEEDIGWGKYLRVRIVIDLSKPLARGRKINVKNNSLWVAFKYEKILKFCFKWSVIRHGKQGCGNIGGRRSFGSEGKNPYGQWLRVTLFNRRGGVATYVYSEPTTKETAFSGVICGPI